MSEQNVVYERIGTLDAKITAAHSRIDRVETVISKDLAEINKDLKAVVAWMNRSLGWAAALLFVGGILGAIIEALIKLK